MEEKIINPVSEKAFEKATMMKVVAWCMWVVGYLVALAPEATARSRLSGTQRNCLVRKLSERLAEEVPVANRDAFAVMDPYTGRIIWLRHPKVLAQHAYPPGSIFKVVPAYLALSVGKVDPQETYRCRGGEAIEGGQGAPVRCWLRPGHGPVNLAKALALSCNLYFARLGSRLGTESILKAARELGFGRITGSDIPGEVPGNLPRILWPEGAAQLAVGQGDQVQVTPLQVLSLIGAVANGGMLFSPYAANPAGDMCPLRGELEDASALRFIRDTMEQASWFGTGYQQHLSELRLAGKTGTATWKGGWRTHAWYMGFAPYQNPLVVLVVFVFNGQGSKDGTAVARKVMEKVYEAMDVCGAVDTEQ